MTPNKARELAEKIVMCGRKIGLCLDGLIFFPQLKSLLSEALEEAKAEAVKDAVLNMSHNEGVQIARAEAVEEVAKIAWDAREDIDGCCIGAAIAELIRQRGEEEK